MSLTFYLGVPGPGWLAEAGVPTFVAYPTLRHRKVLPRAIAPWALDSGGYTELRKHGEWRQSPKAYAAGVRRLQHEVGMLDFACPQDWVCAPPTLAATGLSVRDHQDRTVTNLLHLLAIAPDVPWVPVLQGWTEGDYHAHADLYDDAGVDLTGRLVAVGSIAARQSDPMVGAIIRGLRHRGIDRLHALGVKTKGLAMYGEDLETADSMAWSFTARFAFKPMLDECKGDHDTCATCLPWALEWRRRLLDDLGDKVDGLDQQMPLFTPDDEYRPREWRTRSTRAGVREHAA